jgi:hypothetical protein
MNAIHNVIEIAMSDLAKWIDYFEKTGDNLFVYGLPGVGKTEIITAVAKARAEMLGLEFWTNGMDAPTDPANTFALLVTSTVDKDQLDLRGMPRVENDVTKFRHSAELPDATRHGARGIWYLDEYPQASPSMQSCFSEPIQAKRLGDAWSLPDGWQIIGAGNHRSMGAATSKMPSHIADRWSIVLAQPDVEALNNYLMGNGSNGDVGGYLRAVPEHLHTLSKGNTECFATGRSWEKVDHAVTNIVDDDTFLAEVVASHVGRDCSAGFMGYLSIKHNMTTFREIVADPMLAKVPEEGTKACASARYALTNMMVQRVDTSNVGQVIAYLKRLPITFQALWAIDCKAWEARQSAAGETPRNITETVAFNELLVILDAQNMSI